MKRTVAFFEILSCVLMMTANGKAQLNADSVVRSILPIAWNINFDCLVRQGPGHYVHTNYTWADELYSYDSVRTLGNTITFVSSPFWSEYGGKVTFTLDTTLHRITLGIEWHDLSNEGGGTFSFDSVLYWDSGSMREAVARIFLAAWMGQTSIGYAESATKTDGWITVGNASANDRVAFASSTQDNFQFNPISGRRMRFSFAASLYPSSIRIFDLLGRMRDEVPIEPQRMSIDYSSDQLPSGLYVAMLGGQCVESYRSLSWSMGSKIISASEKKCERIPRR